MPTKEPTDFHISGMPDKYNPFVYVDRSDGNRIKLRNPNGEILSTELRMIYEDGKKRIIKI